MKDAALFYDFTEVNSTIIGDNSGNGAAGVVRNYESGGMSFTTENIYGQIKRILQLPGGSDGGYVELPSGILNENHGVSVNFWFRLWEIPQEEMVFALGRDRALYLRILTQQRLLHNSQEMADDVDDLPECRSESGEFGLLPCITTGGTSQEWSVRNRMRMSLGRWYMITITFDGEAPSHLRFYVDSEFMGEMANRRMAADMLMDADRCCFGKGLKENRPIKADFADFGLYKEVLEQEEVRELFDIDDQARTAADAEGIHLPQTTVEALELPTAGTYGSTITWESDQEAVITKEGAVTRPSSESGDHTVTLQATLTCGEAVLVKQYQITVPALPTTAEMLKEAAEALTALMKDYLYQDLELPETGLWGTKITYQAMDPEYLTAEGKVTRPSSEEEAAAVTLTAQLSLEGQSYEKQLQGLVLPVRAKKEILDVQPVTVRVIQGGLPLMPERITVYYTDGSEAMVPVQWELPEPAQLETPGSYTLTGTLGEARTDEEAALTEARLIVEDPAVKKTATGKTFRLKQTRLTGTNILTENYQRDLDYLKLVDADRMLYNFRKAFGEDTKGAKPVGGWEEPMGLLRGHSTGHLMSALAYAYGYSEDPEILEKMNYIVRELRSMQLKSQGRPSEFRTECSPVNAAQRLWSKNPSVWGEGFISAYPPDQFALLEQFTPYATIWAPYYTLHKILAGFLDAYLKAGNEEALEAAKGIGSWVEDRLSAISEETRAKMWAMYIAGEYGGMNESLSTLYLITGEDKYRKAAAMFDNPKVFDGMAEGRDTISGIHANQHIPQIIGAMQEYKATGNRRYFEIARNFWEIAVQHYSYSIGGVGRGEIFKEPDILAGNIDGASNCETCAAYNLLKLTKELYAYDPDVKYMDYYERTLLNQIAASQDPIVTEEGHNAVTYMLPIGPGAHRTYTNDYNDFTCCHGTGMENHVKYQENIFFDEEDHIDLNLYVPGTLELEEGCLKLEGTWPGERFTLTAEGAEVTVRLRIPDWCRESFTVIQKEEVIAADPDDRVTVTLTDGESVTIETPYQVHFHTTPDKLDGVTVGSVMYGPFVMTVKNASNEWLTYVLSDQAAEDFTPVWEDGVPTLHHNEDTLIPMYLAHHMPYHAYIKMIQP